MIEPMQNPQTRKKWYERPWYLNPISLGLLTIAGVFGAGATYKFFLSGEKSVKNKENIVRKVQELEYRINKVEGKIKEIVDKIEKEYENLLYENLMLFYDSPNSHEPGIAGKSVTWIKISKETHKELLKLIEDMETEENKYENPSTDQNGKYKKETLHRIIKKIDFNKDGKITDDEVESARKITLDESQK